jgi:hypothetical protein
MRYFPIVLVVAPIFAGCNPAPSAPAGPVVPARVVPAQGANVEVGGPQGGVHVQAPDRVPGQGTNVDVDQSGVHVRAPGTKVDVP